MGKMRYNLTTRTSFKRPEWLAHLVPPETIMHKITRIGRLAVLAGIFFQLPLTALHASDISDAATAVEARVIAWRRDIHQNPELSNQEFRTANLVAEHLRALDFDKVQTGVAHTGVVGILKGAHPGPVVALRADMDALPVTEKVDVSFASRVKVNQDGQQVGVMHACGHDAHTAILMGVAEVLAGMRDQLHGTVVFIFQPAEETATNGEPGGAKMMIEQGVLAAEAPPEAIFALHVGALPLGTIIYKEKGMMAAADGFRITVKGKQTHGSMPWRGVDPIVVAGQIANAIQLIPARQLDVTKGPAVISIGSIHGGVLGNIIPDEVEMSGTIRSFDAGIQQQLHQRLRNTVTHLASAAGAEAEVDIQGGAPVTFNDPQLTQQAVSVLQNIAGIQRVIETRPIMGSEDFAFFQQEIPGFYFILGVNKAGVVFGAAAPNHSPYFYVNEDALKIGVESLSALAINFLNVSASSTTPER
jgi:amidohydrolase